ncbi:MAG: DUF2934 domain-containing protein, partial [Nitrosospira sp.]
MEHSNHPTKKSDTIENKLETRPAQEEVAKKAYAIYEKEGHPQGHDKQNWLAAEAQLQHAGANHKDHSGHPDYSDHPDHSEHSDHQDHQDHHAHMAADYRKRFWISLALTLPILILSPLLQTLVGLREVFRFSGDIYVLFGFSSAVFWYGGWPFLKGLFNELTSRTPGMMTLVAVAITTAYLYSSAVVFGLTGKMFFWELATLVDIMLLGHWIEMKSVMGAS